MAALIPTALQFSQLAPSTRPAAMGKRAQLLRAAFTLGLFSMLKKSPLCLLPLALRSSSVDSSPPTTGSGGGTGVLGDGPAHISSGSVAEQQLQLSD